MEKVSCPRTNLTRWRLITIGGIHRWSYLAEEDAKKQPLSFAEKYCLGLPQVLLQLIEKCTLKQADCVKETLKISEPQSFADSAANGLHFYQKLQLDDGHWARGYGGISFLVPCLVFAMYITETLVPSEWKTELIAWISDKTNEDGGWGLHLLGDTAVFSTTLYYVTFRVLGLDVSDPLVIRTRTRLLALGTN